MSDLRRNRMKERPDLTEQTRKNLIAAYWKCLDQSEDINSVTAKQIAATAGYHRSTFYAYFDSANQIGEIADDDLMEGLKSLINEAVCKGAGMDLLEKTLSLIFALYGTALRVRLRQRDAEAFASQIRNILYPLARCCRTDSKRDAVLDDLCCELATSDILTALTYLSRHPEIPQEKVELALHRYFHGGVPYLENTTYDW